MINKISIYVLRMWTLGLMFLGALPSNHLFAQDIPDFSFLEISEKAEKRFGPSFELLNGEKYNYPYRSARGNPFFEIKGDQMASVQINGSLFENQRIRYDIYNQLVVLDFKDQNGAPGSIVLRNEWLDYLIIGGFQFKKFQYKNGLERFGQVISEDKYSCVYFWDKEYTPDLQQGQKTYRFSDPNRDAYILFKDGFTSFSGRRSFLRCFPKPIQIQIKTYLKENRIRIKKAADLQMRSIMILINKWSDGED